MTSGNALILSSNFKDIGGHQVSQWLLTWKTLCLPEIICGQNQSDEVAVIVGSFGLNNKLAFDVPLGLTQMVNQDVEFDSNNDDIG